MTPGDGAPPDVLRQYARCYIMMMIGGALFPDKTNNIVSEQIIVGFGHSVLDIPAPVHREQARQLGDERLLTPSDIVDLLGIPPLLSTRQRPCGLSPCFPICSPSLNGLGQIYRDTHARRMLEFLNKLDRVGVDDFVWTPYMALQWRVMEPGWVNEVGEIETWLATVPIVLFMYVRFHHVAHVKRQFGSEQAVPLDPVNPDRLLKDPSGAQLPDDVPPAATQERDPIVLPRDAHARGRRARMQRPDIRRKDEGAPTSVRSDTQPGGDHVDEEAGYRRHEDIPEGAGAQDSGGGGRWPCAARTRRRLLLRRGYRAGSVHPIGRGLCFRIRPTSTLWRSVGSVQSLRPAE
ncbi:hypothetical protein PIB30_033011 [Stylosanthes scabra]|uniref:Aminotransferase-like plant mobile domain-containing protein n=1 Tax=Stylosanthes scabra TaxID=79078 RepID=A0ABU6VAC9_9FABA|nr:hypothetical protein [Stylosanthes scabra]